MNLGPAFTNLRDCALIVRDRKGIILGTIRKAVAMLPFGTRIEVSKIGQKIVNGQILADDNRVFAALIARGRLGIVSK